MTNPLRTGMINRMDDVSESINHSLPRLVPICSTMGIRLTEATVGRAVATVPATGNTNHVGTMYAGVLFSVAEILGGAISTASFEPARFFPIVRDVRIQYLKPATTTVTASAALTPEQTEKIRDSAEENGKVDFTLDAELVDANGVVVARTQSVYQLRQHSLSH